MREVPLVSGGLSRSTILRAVWLAVLVSLLAANAIPAVTPPVIGDHAPQDDVPQHAEVPTVVAFFATWCVPCEHNLADILFVRGQLVSTAPQGFPFQLILFNAGQSPETIQSFQKSHKLPEKTQIVRDLNGSIARRWGSNRLPTTFIVDTSGVIRHINRGHGAGFRTRFERWLRKLRR